jgi:hypothetical protein
MTCVPDPEPCERCGAPLFIKMLKGQPVGWVEVQCVCFARDHHRPYGECLPRVPHTPERCTAERNARGNDTAPPEWTNHPSMNEYLTGPLPPPGWSPVRPMQWPP